jgi:hypothetical protein
METIFGASPSVLIALTCYLVEALGSVVNFYSNVTFYGLKNHFLLLLNICAA